MKREKCRDRRQRQRKRQREKERETMSGLSSSQHKKFSPNFFLTTVTFAGSQCHWIVKGDINSLNYTKYKAFRDWHWKDSKKHR